MNVARLDKLFAVAGEFAASDLHLISGVPPAYRINGEIILADHENGHVRIFLADIDRGFFFRLSRKLLGIIFVRDRIF